VPVEDTPEGQLLKTQLYAFAEYDRQKIILRTMMGRRAKASIGKVVGTGTPPYAYRYFRETLPTGKDRVCGLELDPATAPIAREALLALRYRSTNDVANDLNARGVPSARGTAWTGPVLRAMAVSPVYTGSWHYGAIAVSVEPLLTEDEAAQIRAALVGRRNARRGRCPVEDDPFLLRGRLTCGRCHGLLQAEFNAGYRYYRCGCAYPSTAREFGRPTCGLPAVNAPALEDELWRILNATLLSADYLASGLEAARAQHEQADHLRTERLATIETEMVKQRKRLDGLSSDLADAGNGEFRASIRRRAQEIEGIIERLRRDRDELTTLPSAGLSADDADAIARFATEVQAGMGHATPAERRMLYQQLQVRGSLSPAVRTDPEAIRLGRHHRFYVDWTASIPLLDSDGRFLKMIAQSSRSVVPFFSSQSSNAVASSNWIPSSTNKT
jgi:hypothetical protein